MESVDIIVASPDMNEENVASNWVESGVGVGKTILPVDCTMVLELLSCEYGRDGDNGGGEVDVGETSTVIDDDFGNSNSDVDDMTDIDGNISENNFDGAWDTNTDDWAGLSDILDETSIGNENWVGCNISDEPVFNSAVEIIEEADSVVALSLFVEDSLR